ncbi:MAG: Crp/Fnr family transcriptional regulator [Gammaproteobacteria bacterium]|nr:Crp/Fnr family transcriptional regulator [Gammaproteobacteria bacterium]
MLDLLKQLPPYDSLDEQGLRSLADIAVRRSYKKNRVIIHQGDDTSTMFILLDGKMRVYVEDNQGKQLTVRILRAGDSFGEVALVGEFPRTASVETLTDCVVAAFARGKYLAFLQQQPTISLALSRSLANMVRETTEELGSIALSDVYGRITHILEKYAVEQDGLRRVPRFTHREIAGMIGSSREMVSKILKELEKGDYISVSERHYVINRILPANW